MVNEHNSVNSEIDRINFGPQEFLLSGLLTADIVVSCDRNSLDVLRKTKKALKLVIDTELPLNDHIQDWEQILPVWFINSCSPSLSQDKVEKMLKSKHGFETLSKMWDLESFLYWFEPEQRSWFWWNGFEKDENTFVIQVLIDGFPFAWDALNFLLRAAGAHSVELD